MALSTEGLRGRVWVKEQGPSKRQERAQRGEKKCRERKPARKTLTARQPHLLGQGLGARRSRTAGKSIPVHTRPQPLLKGTAPGVPVHTGRLMWPVMVMQLQTPPQHTLSREGWADRSTVF